MPLIIAVALGKGGVGKSTIAHALAHAATAAGGEGAKVTLVDYDSQGTSIMWANLAAQAGTPLPYNVVVPPDHNLTRWVRQHADESQCVVIDGHPLDDEHNRSAARNAHVVVVPTEPFLADLVRIPPWLAEIDKLGKRSIVVINKVPTHTHIDAEQTREFLTKTGATVADVELTNRASIGRNFGKPLGRLLSVFGRQLLDEVLR